MASIEALGWASSAIIVVTIAAQVHKQWHDDTSRGVSAWLFVGQAAASIGFLVYSVARGNWIFAVTNGLLLAAAIVGLGILLRHRRRARRRGGAAQGGGAG